MKLSDQSLEVLKNFASINSNIAINSDKLIRTVSNSKNLMASTSIIEDVPYDFGIYDLSEFIAVIGMFDDPNFEFDDDQKFVRVKGSTGSIKYFFSDIDNLTVAKKDVVMPDPEIKFDLTNSQLNQIRKASGAMKLNNLVVTRGNNGVTLTVTDISNPTSNEFSIDIDKCNIDTDKNFELIMDISLFKFIVSDVYSFGLSSKRIASVNASSTNYWVALEKTSTFGV